MIPSSCLGAEKTEIENQWVRVMRVTQAPHEKSSMHFAKKAHDVAYFEGLKQAEENISGQPIARKHEHPSYVVVYLTVLHTTQTLPDGRKVDNPRKPGEVAWRDALAHVTENIGEKRDEEIQIELK